MTRRPTNNRTPWFLAGALVLFCVAAVVVASLFLRQLSFLPWQDPFVLRNSENVIESSVAIDPDHIHVGDAFTLILTVAVDNGQAYVHDMSAQEVLQSGIFDILAARKTVSAAGSITRYEYRYMLQALNALPGQHYVVKFTSLNYVKSGAEKEFSIPDETVDVASRFLEDANPFFAPPYGKMQTYHQYVRWSMEGLAALFLCAGFVAARNRLQKKKVTQALNPIRDLFMRYKMIDAATQDPRSVLFAVEHIAIALAALNGVSVLQLWQGKYPAHAQTHNLWEELWRNIAHAYAADSNKQHAQIACAQLSALLDSYNKREGGR